MTKSTPDGICYNWSNEVSYSYWPLVARISLYFWVILIVDYSKFFFNIFGHFDKIWSSVRFFNEKFVEICLCALFNNFVKWEIWKRKFYPESITKLHSIIHLIFTVKMVALWDYQNNVLLTLYRKILTSFDRFWLK